MDATQPLPANLADLTVACLEHLGIEFVFGIPGGHIAALYEALDRSAHRGGPRAILARHETGAAYMADGYARETGKPGVCCATTGPGVTNLMTGVATAYSDQVPLLVITAQTLLPHFGNGAFQESSPDGMDAAGMLACCTRYNTVVTHPAQFEQKLMTALHQATCSPGGPVHLSVPVDIYRAAASPSPRYPARLARLQQPALLCDLSAVDALWQAIVSTREAGQGVVILAGHDCAGAGEAVLDFATRIQARVITSHRGKRWIDAYHPTVRGVFGYAGHESARAALTDAATGLIIVAGSALGQWSTANWDTALLNDRLVHIHSDAGYFSRSPMARLHVQGHTGTVFARLLSHAATTAAVAPVAPIIRRGLPPGIEVRNMAPYRSESVPLHPQRVLSVLMERFPADTRYLVDTSCWLPWTLHYFFTTQTDRYRLSSELAAMGWAIGAAVGTALAHPQAPVVCLTGDGCYLMFGQEVAVAVAERLPVVFIILNDSGYGMVKHRHRQISDTPLDFALSPVDFALMAQAVGAEGWVIHTVADLERYMRPECLFNKSGPTVLDIRIDPEASPPTGMF